MENLYGKRLHPPSPKLRLTANLNRKYFVKDGNYQNNLAIKN